MNTCHWNYYKLHKCKQWQKRLIWCYNKMPIHWIIYLNDLPQLCMSPYQEFNLYCCTIFKSWTYHCLWLFSVFLHSVTLQYYRILYTTWHLKNNQQLLTNNCIKHAFQSVCHGMFVITTDALAWQQILLVRVIIYVMLLISLLISWKCLMSTYLLDE